MDAVEAPMVRYRHTRTGRGELGTEPLRWRHSYCLSVVGELGLGERVWCFSWVQCRLRCQYPVQAVLKCCLLARSVESKTSGLRVSGAQCLFFLPS